MQVLDLRSWTWSKVEVKAGENSSESPSPVAITPCAGHTLVSICNEPLLLIFLRQTGDSRLSHDYI